METKVNIKRLENFFGFIEKKSPKHKIPEKFLEIKGHLEKMDEEKSKLPNQMWIVKVLNKAKDIEQMVLKGKGMGASEFKEILQKGVSELDREFHDNLYVRNYFIDKVTLKLMNISKQTLANYWNGLHSLSTDDKVLKRMMRLDMQQYILPDYFLSEIVRMARYKQSFIDYLVDQGFDRQELRDML